MSWLCCDCLLFLVLSISCQLPNNHRKAFASVDLHHCAVKWYIKKRWRKRPWDLGIWPPWGRGGRAFNEGSWELTAAGQICALSLGLSDRVRQGCWKNSWWLWWWCCLIGEPLPRWAISRPIQRWLQRWANCLVKLFAGISQSQQQGYLLLYKLIFQGRLFLEQIIRSQWCQFSAATVREGGCGCLRFSSAPTQLRGTPTHSSFRLQAFNSSHTSCFLFDCALLSCFSLHLGGWLIGLLSLQAISRKAESLPGSFLLSLSPLASCIVDTYWKVVQKEIWMSF